MSIKKITPWLAGIVLETVSAIFCIVYAAKGCTDPIIYLQLLGASLLPFAVPVLGLITKKEFPWALSVAFAVFVFMACNLGSVLKFYDKIPSWDLIMHGVFGFLCSLVIFVLLLRWNGAKLNPIGFMIIIFVFTMGVAALWEVMEYVMDLITHGDSQRVEESIALGKSPVADTMEDIIIAMAGVAVFYITLLADKFNKYKFYSRFCNFNGFEREADAQPPTEENKTLEE